MDYQRIYEQLVERAKNRVLDGYKERHHIIPRCINGSDDTENIVELTAKEHYLAHRLLTEIYPTNPKIKYAFWMMCSMKTDSQKRYEISARSYEYSKKLIAYRSEETRKKISNSLKDSYKNGSRSRWNIGKKMPPEFGEAISKAKKGMVGTNTGIPMSEEQKEKIRNTLSGHEVKQSTRDKISQTLLNKPEITCPHCNKSSKGTSFKIYHFDHCKYKK